VVAAYQSFTEPDAALNDLNSTSVATLTLPAGAFLVSATVSFAALAADNFSCVLTDGASSQLDVQLTGTTGTSAAFLGLTGVTANGGTETISCGDSVSNGFVTFVSVTAIPASSVVAKPAHLSGRYGLPRLLRPPTAARHTRHGAARAAVAHLEVARVT
jgi:hypothetical protein